MTQELHEHAQCSHTVLLHKDKWRVESGVVSIYLINHLGDHVGHNTCMNNMKSPPYKFLHGICMWESLQFSVKRKKNISLTPT